MEYTSITMDKAREIFQTEGDYLILDVRRADEFAEVRSKQAATKLAAMGYANIVEFGGIIDWTGDIEK